jgi:alpha-ketoglutarate-dependent taurine dioxygenase
MTLKAIDLTPRVGTEIKVDAAALLSGAHTDDIRNLLERRGALVFRRVNFTPEQLMRFSKTLGEVVPEREGVRKISLDENEHRGSEYLRASFYWHLDGTLDEFPARATLLSAQVLSKSGGGQTEFANTYTAYDDLSEEDKKACDKVRVIHSFETVQRVVTPMPSYAQLKEWRRIHERPRSHPLVWHHRSGRKSLVLGATASHVEGMSLDEGRELLCRLLDLATQPQNVYRHEWEVGDLVVYDNTGTLHRAIPYAADSGRLMHRTALVGEEQLV